MCRLRGSCRQLNSDWIVPGSGRGDRHAFHWTRLQKPIALGSPRIQRMRLQMQQHDSKLVYKPDLYEEEELVHATLDLAIPAVDTRSGGNVEWWFVEATATDPTVRMEKQLVQSGWPENPKRVPVPSQPVLERKRGSHCCRQIQDGHFGESKCIKGARSSVYWSGCAEQIRNLVAGSSIYQNLQNCPVRDARGSTLQVGQSNRVRIGRKWIPGQVSQVCQQPNSCIVNTQDVNVSRAIISAEGNGISSVRHPVRATTSPTQSTAPAGPPQPTAGEALSTSRRRRQSPKRICTTRGTVESINMWSTLGWVNDAFILLD